MKKIKRIARLLGLVCLIVLASIGIGISGGVPILLLKKRRESEKENTELVEEKDKKPDSKESQIVLLEKLVINSDECSVD